MIADTPQPPYYAVIFTSIKSTDDDGYAETAQRMVALAQQQPGFLGVESAREGVGITVSYWSDMESIQAWKRQTEHLQAQKRGRENWYSNYQVRVCKVEREYSKA